MFRSWLFAWFIALAVSPLASAGPSPPNPAANVLLRISVSPAQNISRVTVRLLFQEVDPNSNRAVPFAKESGNGFLFALDPQSVTDSRDGWYYVRAAVKPGRYVLSFAVVRYESAGAILRFSGPTNKSSYAYDLSSSSLNDLGDYKLPLGKLDGNANSALKFLGFGEGARPPAIGADASRIPLRENGFECAEESGGFFTRRKECYGTSMDAIRDLGGLPMEY